MTLSRVFHDTVVSSHRTITSSSDHEAFVRHPPNGEQKGRGLRSSPSQMLQASQRSTSSYKAHQ